jgi:hypothetical protein
LNCEIWDFRSDETTLPRLMSWQELGGRLFDDHLDTFKVVALEVLKVDDPSFELPGEERYAAIHGKVLPHSNNLRKGLAESLALIGNRADVVIRQRCKPDDIKTCLLNNQFSTKPRLLPIFNIRNGRYRCIREKLYYWSAVGT